RHVHERSLSAGHRGWPTANPGRLDGRAHAGEARRLDRLRRGGAVRPDHRRGRHGGRGRGCDARRSRLRPRIRRAGAVPGRRAGRGGRAVIGIGVVGYGYWGPNLVRNFNEVGDARVRKVCDLRSDRMALVRQRYPTVETTTDYRDILDDPAVDAVVIAT